MTCRRKTGEIFTDLNASTSHIFYSTNRETNGHFLPLHHILIDEKRMALDFYEKTVNDMPEEKLEQKNSNLA